MATPESSRGLASEKWSAEPASGSDSVALTMRTDERPASPVLPGAIGTSGSIGSIRSTTDVEIIGSTLISCAHAHQRKSKSWQTVGPLASQFLLDSSRLVSLSLGIAGRRGGPRCF